MELNAAVPPQKAIVIWSGRFRIEQHSSIGILWVIGWPFSIGFLNLQFWYGVVAFFVWPYFLGEHFGGMEAQAQEDGATLAAPQ
jgi:hypothetical protein